MLNFEFNKFLEISARVALAILIACILLLFFPSSVLPFDIVSFRASYGIWIFVVLVISASLFLSYVGKWIVGFIKKKLEKRRTWETYKYILKNLSNDEKIYLQQHYKQKQTAIMFSLTDPVAKKLETFRIISMAAGTSIAPRGMVSGFIQPWVFELIDKHPEYLKINGTEKQEEKKNG